MLQQHVMTKTPKNLGEWAVDPSIFADWIREKMGDKGLTQQALADHLGMRKEGLNRRIHRGTRFRVDELTKIAERLGEPLDVVLRRYGVRVSRPSRAMAPVHGIADAAGEITTRGASKLPHVDRPITASDDTQAIVVRAPGTAIDGWRAFYVPGRRIDPAAIGRLAVVTLTDGREYLRVIHKTSGGDGWTLRLLRSSENAPAIENVAVASAVPVACIVL